MVVTLSLMLGYACVFLLPGYALIRGRVKSELAPSITLTDIIIVSLAANIGAAYFGLLTGLGSPLYFIIAALIFGIIGGICLIRDVFANRINLPLGMIAICLLTTVILFKNIGYPIIAWDGIFVWEAMTDALVQGKARDKTASYPHGLGALGAVMGTTASALDFNVALRSLTAILPIVALIGVLNFASQKFRLILGLFAALFIYLLVNGMDSISYKYASSFTSDMFLFVATTACLFFGIRLAHQMQKHQGGVWALMKRREYILFLASVFVAANAKQTGLSYALLPGLAALIYPIGKAEFSARILQGIVLTIPALFVGLIWYMITVIIGVGAAGGSNPAFLLFGAHQGRDAAERLIWAVNQAQLMLPTWFWIGTIILAIAALKTRKGWMALMIILPTLIFYLFVGGYAARNVTGAIGGLFVMSIIGLDYVLHRVLPGKTDAALYLSYSVAGQKLLAVSLAVMIGAGVALSGPFNKMLTDRYIKGSAEIGFGGINNTVLKAMQAISSEKGALVTNYAVAGRLAALDQYRVVDTVGYKVSSIFEAASKDADETENTVLFIIWPDRSPEAFQEYLRCILNTAGIRDAGTKWQGKSGTRWVLVDLQQSGAVQACTKA